MLHVLDHSFRCIIKESEKKKSREKSKNLAHVPLNVPKRSFHVSRRPPIHFPQLSPADLSSLPRNLFSRILSFQNSFPENFFSPLCRCLIKYSRGEDKTSVWRVSELSSSLSLSLDSCSSTTPLPPFTKTPVILLCKPSNHKLYRGP